MIKLSILGRIGQDAQVKDLNNKKALSFSVYSSKKIKGQNGQDEWQSTFVNCTYFTERADDFVKWLGKGRSVYVEGEPRVRTYTAKDNSTQAVIDLTIRELQFAPQVDLTIRELQIAPQDKLLNQATTTTTQQVAQPTQQQTYKQAPPTIEKPADDLPF